MANVVEVSDTNFKSEVLDSKQPVLVDFYATWCGPCKMLSPVVEDVAKEYTGKLKVVKVDVDNSQEVAGQFGIMSVPTVMFFKNGQEVGRSVGAVPKGTLVDHIKKSCGV